MKTSTPVDSMVAVEPSGEAVPVGAEGSFVVAPVVPDPGEMDPTVPGLWVPSAVGTRTAKGTPTPEPCGAEEPGPPSDCGTRRAPPVVPPGCLTWSLDTGSLSKATPARPPSAP